MKRIIALLCCLVLVSTLISAYATDEVEGQTSSVTESIPTPYETSSEPSSMLESSSILESSQTPSMEESSDLSEASSEQSDTSSKPQSTIYRSEQESSGYVENNVGGTDNDRPTAVLVLCYIISALIGLCLIGLIVVNVVVPISNKKRQLKSEAAEAGYYDDDYDIGGGSPQRRTRRR